MKIILLILFVAGFYSCVGSNLDPKEYTENPCQDVLYKKLMKIKVSEMTGSEREYFNMKDKECEEFSDQHIEEKSDKEKAKQNLMFILYGAGLLIAVALFLSISMKGWH